MTHEAFVTAAYVVTALGTLALLIHSGIVMRNAEALADDLRQER